MSHHLPVKSQEEIEVNNVLWGKEIITTMVIIM